MIDIIWIIMILTSLVFSFVNGKTSELSSSLFEGAKTAVDLSISLLGGMCFWLGITELMKASGLSKKINRLLLPIINRLFPSFKNDSGINEKISLNITANLLGLGNAATAIGLDAVKEILKKEKDMNTPSKEMILFVAINTASLQILPTQMAMLRSSFSSESPFSILIPVWIVSCTAIFTVVLSCKLLEKRDTFGKNN